MWSLADTLERAAPRLEEALGSPAALARFRGLAGRLPAALTRRVYLESWLGLARPRVDVIVKIEPGDRGALADPDLAILDPELRGQPGWQRLAAFARDWAEPDGPLDRGVRALWLEFDLDPAASSAEVARAPRFFADFHRAAQCQPSVEARLDLALDVLRRLSGASGARAREPLRACLHHLPPGATLAYLGVFPRGGEEPVVRACLVGLQAALPAYLGAVGWPGDPGELERQVLAPLALTQGGADAITVVHLDVAASVGPRLGFEYTFARPGRPGVAAEGAFFDELIGRGWCTAQGRAALLSWPGRSVELLPHDIWHSQVTRRIGHVKVTYSPGEPVVAKGYLSVGYDLLPGGSLLGEKPRVFAALGPGSSESRAQALSAEPPLDPAALEPAPPPSNSSIARAAAGTAVALPGGGLLGGTGMTMSSTQQEALERILARAGVDLDFRRALLVDPRKAILDGFGVRIPSSFRVKFVERERNVDALIVLPDYTPASGELDDCDLEAVAGGGDTDPTDVW